MFTTIGHLAVRRRRLVLVLSLAALVLSGVLGVGVFARLSSGGFEDPGSESVRAADLLAERFDTGSPDLVLVVSADSADSADRTRADGTTSAVDRPDVAAEGLAITEELAAIDGTDDVTSYWSLGSPAPLRSADGDKALILLRVPGDEDDADRAALVDRLIEDYDTSRGPVTVEVGGGERIFAQVSETIEGDLARAESIAIPLTLLLLIVVFGSLVAALLPVAVGAAAILGAFLVLFGVTALTDVSIFSINLVTAMGLGLAIDYSLLVVNRFREELANGRPVDTAVVRTVETAGRTVAFSGLTVAVSLAALLVFPLYFLRSFAYAGIGVILVAMVTSVVTLPALLAVLGPRVDRWRIRPERRPGRPGDATGGLGRGVAGDGLWHRVAAGVMRRPVAVALTASIFLLALGTPFLGVQFGVPDDRVLPEGDPARAVADVLRDEFDSSESDAFPIVATGPATAGADDPADNTDTFAAAAPRVDAFAAAAHRVDTFAAAAPRVDTFAVAVSEVDGVARVDAPTGRYADGQMIAPPDPTLAALSATTSTADAATTSTADGDGDGGDRSTIRLNVVPSVEPISPEAEAMIDDIRAIDAPFDEVVVGGRSAELVDSKAAIFGLVPLAGGLIALSTFVLLFLMFGSVLVPLKAIVLNTLSLTASFGAMVWVFQDGNGADLLGFTATGLTDTTMPILMFCVAFGLSMDYEVFLLSRIKEEHDRTGDNELSVAVGLEKTGRLVTAAALLLSITFFAFATSGVTFIKLMGLGLGLAVLVDAFIVRVTLVPALMKLAGEWNWWAPPALRRLHARFGISEAGSDADHLADVDRPDEVTGPAAAIGPAEPPTGTIARAEEAIATEN